MDKLAWVLAAVIVPGSMGCLRGEEAVTQRTAALMNDDGSPWEPEGGGGGGGGGDDPWVSTEHSCWVSSCSFTYELPAGSCTEAAVFGPGCAAAIAEWTALAPDSPVHSCGGAILDCANPGDAPPCTGPCRMRVGVNGLGACHPVTAPCGPGFVCGSDGYCTPGCDGGACQPGSCDPATGVCAPCSTTSPCVRPQDSCIAGRCVETCSANAPCSRGACNVVTGECEVCADGGCGNQICDPLSGRCRDAEQCGPGSPCAWGNCVDGTCRGCTAQECGQDVCDPDSGRCRSRCSGPDECIGGQTCIDGVCRTPCNGDPDCDVLEYCDGGYCKSAYSNNGQCPRPDMVPEGPWCRASCATRTNACPAPAQVCDPVTGSCAINCGGPEPFTGCIFTETCLDGICVRKCDPRVTSCPNGDCHLDEADNPVCGDGGGCLPSDLCCGIECPGSSTCDPTTGLCVIDLDPCAMVTCDFGWTCNDGLCQPEGGGCVHDFDCWFDEVCEDGVCVSGGSVDVCAADGACTAGETCSCEAWCCGPGGGGSGGGGGCGWDGGSTISYGDCHACGGHVTWVAEMDAFACEGLSST